MPKTLEDLFRQKGENQKGAIAILMVVMIIAAAFFLVNGIFNDVTNKKTDNLTEYTLITPPPGDAHKNLQLNTLKFQACGSTAAIGFLVDQSGSFSTRYGPKEENLKNGLRRFARNFPDQGIIGLRTYSDDPAYTPIVVPFDVFNKNRPDILRAIDTMQPARATHSRTGFERIQQDINSARISFPNQNFYLVFISDGIPESLGATQTFCPGNNYATSDKTYCGPHPENPSQCRCFDPGQDPTQVANQLKASGVKIFSLVYLYDIADERFRNQLEQLMKNVASPPDPNDPSKVYYFEAPFDAQLDDIVDRIKTQICTNN